MTEGWKSLATQDILTYCWVRTLPYHLYADGFDLFVFGASLPSASLSKNKFFDRLKRGIAPLLHCVVSYSTVSGRMAHRVATAS